MIAAGHELQAQSSVRSCFVQSRSCVGSYTYGKRISLLLDNLDVVKTQLVSGNTLCVANTVCRAAASTYRHVPKVCFAIRKFARISRTKLEFDYESEERVKVLAWES